MLTAIVVAFVSVGGVIIICAGLGMCFGKEAGAAPQRRCVLSVEHPGSGACDSQHQVEPTYHPDAKSESVVDPVFRVVFIVVFAFCQFMLREAIWSVVLLY